ncbi:class I SAM-dependent methyltransferase [Methanoregula sp.]|uniref:class I SAM-dependent methyltransferase n=1 Tax=Methanoregula sp. TaxID=2052170 RepID=UPI003564BE6A
MDVQPSSDPCQENDDFAEYQQQLALFSSCSTEKGIELLKIGMVMQSLDKREAFLDIGAGGGHLTIPISQLFDRTTVVEPNPRQAGMFRSRCPGFRIYNDSWINVDPGSDRFDMILCSHVLYYIPDGAWMATIEKMYCHLLPGGCLVIVMQSPLGEVARFFNAFTTYDVPVIELVRAVIDHYGDEAVRLEYFQNEIFSKSLDEMTEIGLFLLIDPDFRKRSADIRYYFLNHHALAGGYRIRQDEILLVIQKPPSPAAAKIAD